MVDLEAAARPLNPPHAHQLVATPDTPEVGINPRYLLQALFVSVDPERDTLAQLRGYTGFFDARIMGVTGSPELVRRAADNFKVRYEKVIDPKVNPAHYAVDHTAGMFLLAPGGQFLAKFPYGKPVDEIVARLREEIALRTSAAGASPQGAAK